MNARNILSVFLLSIFLGNNVATAQETRVLFKQGHKFFKLEHYRKALPYLEKVVEAEPENSEALFETGVCYLFRYSKEQALKYLLKAYTLDSNKLKNIHFWLGRAYHQNYMFDKAIIEYNTFKSELRKSDSRNKEIEKYISEANTARELIKNPEYCKITNLGRSVNSIYSEHSPVFSSNDSILLFTSRRQDVTGGKEDLDGEFFEDIYISNKLNSGEWSKPEKVHLNTNGHDGSVQLFDNDTKMLIYNEAKGGDIYITEKESQKDTWKTPMKFAGINTADFEANAYITPDGKTAYFSTNHYNKTGHLDIFYITKDENGNWSKPKDIPGKINTKEDEDAPFLSADGKTLYFCSRGHKNMGGFDIFKCRLDSSGNWSNPVNMGYPINTPDDDVYFFLVANGTKGYFSSYREGGFGEKDIYEFAFIPKVDFIAKLNFCEGKQREELSYEIKPVNPSVIGQAQNGKLSTNGILANLLADNSYKLSIYDLNDTLFSEVFEVPMNVQGKMIIEKNISIACPEAIIASNGKVSIRPYFFRGMNFDKKQNDLTVESRDELAIASEILKKNPTAEVKIKWNSRSEGNSQGLKEMESIRNQLKANGVTNALTDTVLYSDKTASIGNREFLIEVKFKDSVNKHFDEKVISGSEVSDEFIFRKVHFLSSKSVLSQDVKHELETVVEILNSYPQVQIEVGGHADAQGSDDLNMKLSEIRAKSVHDYLIRRGIQPDRLSLKAYGEAIPIRDNKTDEGRRMNRRVEFKIK